MESFTGKGVRVFAEKIIRVFAVLSVFAVLLKDYAADPGSAVFLACFALLLLINDYARSRYLSVAGTLWSFSFVLSNLCAGFLLWKVYCTGTQLYIIILLVELIVGMRKVPVPLLLLHMGIFSASLAAGHTAIKYIITSYAIMFVIVYLFRNAMIEKARTQVLNQELEKANLALKQYSVTVRELTLSKERTRIAQELHDSLGHYLTALNMHLEFAHKAVDLETDKIRSVVGQSYQLSRECMVQLRQAVLLLNEEQHVQELSLQRQLLNLFAHFQAAGQTRFELNMDEDIEAVNFEIKDCIYKTVQESITNGIKHGKATLFSLAIHKNPRQISLLIANNGTGCREVIKSNGIQGIEQRIHALGGTVQFDSNQDSGFKVQANIPKMVDF
ncbi:MULTISPECIES: sensor histidine kinase [unclassified Paenibacillus]|uniref:sensor histidine kinase n=1 Tax=unclassified Paenibacillus TaxID=185978 RepID=UPI0030F71CCB